MFTNKDREAFNRLQEEAYYERAMDELNRGVKRQGLWLKAMTMCDGNEPKAKLKYIELLIQAYRDEDHVATRAAEFEQRSSEQQQYTIPPTNVHPTLDPDLASLCRKGIIFTFLGYFILAMFIPKIADFGFLFLISIAFFCGGLAKSISENKWLYGILGLIPLINLFVILVLFNKSNKLLKDGGYKLSFFGGAGKA